MIVSSVNASNLQVDGVLIDIVTAPPQLPAGPATGLVAVVGGANYGPMDTPTPFVDFASAQAAFGTDTISSFSLLRESLTAMPECTFFLGVRRGDGTQAAATITIADGSAGVVALLTAKFTGSLPNGQATAIISLQSVGVSGINPVYQAVLNFPGKPAEVYSNIIGYASLGGVYDPVTFKANFLAAINGTTRGSVGSANWTATSGVSTSVVATQVNTASGGVDGTSGLTAATVIGTPGSPAGGTGIYALTGLISGAQFIVASLTDPTKAQTLNTFALAENAIGHICTPKGTSTDTAIANRQADSISSSSLVYSTDWLFVFDQISGLNMFVSPMGKIAGVIASQAAYLSPGNQPTPNGVSGVITTERIVNGINSVGFAEAAQRQVNGIAYIGYMPSNRRGPQLGMPHGITSAGLTASGWSRISDSRMLKFIVDEIQTIEGTYVDGPMSTAANNLGQPTLQNVEDALNSFFGGLVNSKPQQLSGASVVPQNTQASVAAGQLIFQVNGQTLSNAQFIINFVQAGPEVNITANVNGSPNP